MTVLTRFNDLYSNLAKLNLKDLESVYHEQIVFDDPVSTHSGLVEVKAYFANLLQNTEYCGFTIHEIVNCKSENSHIDHVVVWTMELITKKLNSGNPVKLDGTSLLRLDNDKIIYHRDYYDLGQMIYENIPILGFFVKKIKQRLKIK